MHTVDMGASAIVVVSANPTCVERLNAVCRGAGYPIPRHISDPMDLVEGVKLPTQREGMPGAASGIGLVPDLTAPPATGMLLRGAAQETRRTDRANESFKLAWCISAVLAAVLDNTRSPLVVVSEDDALATILRGVGMPLVELVTPDDADITWQRALVRLVAEARRTHGVFAHEAERRLLPESAIKLGEQLWLDLEGCAVIKGEETIPLTARENRIAAILVRAPRHFHSPHELSRRLARPSAFDIDEHSIQQTISNLRRKFGEASRQPRLLVSRRGIGYALCPADA